MDLGPLLRALRERLGEREPTVRVIITADAKAAHADVVRAMDAAGRVGLSRVSITTRQPEEEE